MLPRPPRNAVPAARPQAAREMTADPPGSM
jgi:hypothetical protein